MNAKLLFVHALSSLHPGTGQGAGVIDLPVAREAGTGLPYLPGSSLKGVLRDRCPQADRAPVFGPETTNAADHAGAAVFADQRLLLLPARSLAGTMAWVTSPFILQRFRRDCLNMGLTPPADTFPAGPSTLKRARVINGSPLLFGPGAAQKVILEDLDLEAHVNVQSVVNWAGWLDKKLFPGDAEWQELFRLHFCIVHDDVLSFLLDTATEVIARNVLDQQKKTAENLWYEEALPAESVLAGLVYTQPVPANGLTAEQVLGKVQALTTTPAQLGGHSTVGRGLCRLVMEA